MTNDYLLVQFYEQARPFLKTEGQFPTVSSPATMSSDYKPF